MFSRFLSFNTMNWGGGRVGLSGLLSCLVVVGCSAPTPPAARLASQLSYTGTGDAKAGQVLFADNCQKCHSLKRGSNNKGPQLLGVYGSASGSLADYSRYSAVFKKGVVWNSENLDALMANPKTHFAGNKMYFDGLDDPQQRQDIIAYMATLLP